MTRFDAIPLPDRVQAWSSVAIGHEASADRANTRGAGTMRHVSPARVCCPDC